MSKLNKIIISFIFILTICINSCLAINMNLTNYSSNTTTDESLTGDVVDDSTLESETDDSSEDTSISGDTSTPTTQTSTSSSKTNISSVNKVSNSNLEFANILNILLIAVGILLILFAIALLIKTSK